MSKQIRKSYKKVVYGEPKILRGKIIQKNKVYKPGKYSLSKIEINIEVNINGKTKIYNTEAWGKLAYCIDKRIKTHDNVIFIGQPTINYNLSYNRSYFMLDSCYKEERFEELISFRENLSLKSNLESERRLFKGLNYLEIRNKYSLNV